MTITLTDDEINASINADTAAFVADNREAAAEYFDKVYGDMLGDDGDSDSAYDEARLYLAVRITRMVCDESDYGAVNAIRAADEIIDWHVKAHFTADDAEDMDGGLDGETDTEAWLAQFEAGQYTDLTTWLWYHTHPNFPRDKLRHTSDVCRSLANKVIAFLKTLPEAAAIQ